MMHDYLREFKEMTSRSSYSLMFAFVYLKNAKIVPVLQLV